MRNSSKTQKIFFGMGWLLIVFGMISNEWLFAALVSPDGILETSTKIAVRLLNIFMILSGLLLIKYRNRIPVTDFLEGDNFLKMILGGGVLLRLIVYIFLAPQNNDNHLGVVEFVASNGAFPTTDVLGQAYQPPLYYFMAAPVAVLGSAKAVQLLSFLFSVANLALFYHLIKTTSLLHDLRTRRHVLLFTALLPQFVIFSNFVSNDSLAFFLGTLVFFQTFRYIDSPTKANLLILSLVLGIGLLTKGTFLAFVPVLLGVVVFIQFRQKSNVKQYLATLGLFASLSLTLGSYKYVENTIRYGKPLVGRDDLGHGWLARQQGTYQGLKSIADINVMKLVRHPILSENTKHAIPLLLYGTFWYSHIPESNFRATYHYPLNLLPRAIYVIGIVPTLLMTLGAAKCLWRSRTLLQRFGNGDVALRLCETLVFLSSLSILMVVVIWGLKHDAWSFFQGRMLFPAFFGIATFLGLGYEAACQWRPEFAKVLNGALFLTYVLLGSYFAAEVGNHLL